MFLPHEANPGRIEFSEMTTVLSTQTKNGLGFGAISVLPCRLVATALLAPSVLKTVTINRPDVEDARFQQGGQFDTDAIGE
jgi:hypothetical protein